MDRRDFLKGAAGAAGLTSLSGCAGFLDGEDDEPRDWEYDDESQDDRVLNARRLEFTGNKETLGHVADEDNNPGDYDGTPVEYEITRTESDWQNLSNDLDAAKERLEDGSYRRGVESYDDLRQEVETALAEAPEDKAPERTALLKMEDSGRITP